MKQLLLISACAAIALPGAALAQHPGDHDHGDFHAAGVGGPGHVRFTGSISHFGARDLDAWRGGHWWHGFRDGRIGWWWWADGGWYFYDAPVYPYPLVVGDYYDTYDDAGPSSGPAAPPAQVWYYCNGPRGYYPYVRACPTGWQTVPATPPDYQGGPQDQGSYNPDAQGPYNGPQDAPPPPQQGGPDQGYNQGYGQQPQ